MRAQSLAETEDAFNRVLIQRHEEALLDPTGSSRNRNNRKNTVQKLPHERFISPAFSWECPRRNSAIFGSLFVSFAYFEPGSPQFSVVSKHLRFERRTLWPQCLVPIEPPHTLHHRAGSCAVSVAFRGKLKFFLRRKGSLVENHSGYVHRCVTFPPFVAKEE